MNTKTTAILLIVFALAIGALVVLRGPSDTPADRSHKPDQTPAAGQALLDPERLGQVLERIALDGGELGTLIELERADGRWRVTHPYRFPAKTGAVDELLAKLAALRGSPTDDADGPVPDANGLTLGYADGETRLWFGARQGAGRAVVTLDDNGGHQNFNVPDTLHDYFEAFDPAKFYADHITPPLLPELSRIEITMPEGPSVLTQRDGGWRIGEGEHAERALDEPIEGQAGLSDFFKLLSRIELSELQPYAGEAGLAQFGLSDPLIRIRLVPFDDVQAVGAKGMEVRVGVPADPQDQTRYLSVGPIDAATPAVFTAPTPDALRLGQPATTFRDPRLTTIPRPQVASVSISKFTEAGTDNTEPAVSSVLAFTPDAPPTLTDAQGETHALDPQRCAAMLTRLGTARATGYLPAQPAAWDALASVTVDSRIGSKADTFTVYADPDSDASAPTVLVRRGKEPTAMRIDREALRALLDPSGLVAEDERGGE